MAQVLRQLPVSSDERFINRNDHSFDAGIFQITDKLALVQTVDFFTPVVDDPYLFGQIAAANSLSDVYAVGGTPLTALNLICFPCHKLGSDVLRDILLGGENKIQEAGATMVGGHSIEDEEPKYGLAVTGIVKISDIITMAGAVPGEALVLTKPLGTGVITTALKGGVVSIAEVEDAIEGMKQLNHSASLAMKEAGASAATDITGFGFLGHAAEMAEASGVTFRIKAGSFDYYPLAKNLAAEGFLPSGAYRNWQFYQNRVKIKDEIKSADETDLLWDSQTSGGLLISVSTDKLPVLLAALEKVKIKGQVVGEVSEAAETRIFLTG